METKFQTSFIPKKTMTPVGLGSSRLPKSGPSVSVFMTIGVLLFIASIAGIGIVFAWKQYLFSAQENYKQQLVEREKQFRVELIEQLKEVDVKINTAKTLLSNHVSTSQIFDVISKFTIENVRFMNMEFAYPEKSGESPTMIMKGYGTNLAALAFQSDVLGQLEQYGLRKIVKNPIISDPALDSSGLVSFGFTASIDGSSLLYSKFLAGEEVDNSSTEQ